MSDLPRVLLCAFDVVPAPTGTSRRITDYLKALNGRFSVVAMTTKTPDVSHIERYQGARLLRVPVGAGDLISKVQAFERAVRRQLESEEFALVHYFDPFAGYSLAELRGDYGYRVLYEAHAFPSLDLRFTQPQLEGDRRFLAKVRRQEMFCLLNADAVVTSSQVAATYLQGLGVPPDHLHLVRAPVELAPYHARANDPDGAPMRILYVGSQVAYQGLPTLLRAARPLLAKDEARLTVLGPRHPDWQPRLEDLVDDLALHGRVDLHPPVPHDDLPRVLAASDVTVLPLEDEERTRAFGGPLAKASEYLAAGRPVIASDLPIARELLPESCTLFVPPGDAAALGAALRQMAEAPRRRIEMGRAARAEAARLVDSAVIRPRLLSLYAELLGRMGRAAVSMEPQAQDSGDLTATPTSKVFGSGRSGSSDSGSGRTPVSYLPRATANARAYSDSQASGIRTEEALGEGLPQAQTATLEALGPLLPARDGTDPAARVASEYTPHNTPAPDEPTAIIREPESDSNEGSDSNITSPGAPIPIMESPERAADAGHWEVAPSVVVAPAMLAEAAKLGVLPPAPTAPGPAKLGSQPPAPTAPESAKLGAQPPPPTAPGPAKLGSQPPAPTAPESAKLGAQPPPPTAPGMAKLGAQPQPPTAPAPAKLGSQPQPPTAPAPVKLGAQPQPPTAPALDLATGHDTLGDAVAAAVEGATGDTPEPAESQNPADEPPSQPGLPLFAGDLDLPLESAAEALAPLPAPPSYGKALANALEESSPPDPTAAVITPPADLRASIEAALQNHPTQPRAAVTETSPPGSPEEPEEISPEDVVDAAEAPPGQSGLPISILDPWLSQVVHGYCPPEGIQFSRHTPPTTMPGRDPKPTPTPTVRRK